MTTTRDHDLDTLLRQLDVAIQASPDDATAQRVLDRVLASERTAPTALPTPARRPVGRWVAAGAAVATAACTVVALPVLNGGDAAFATWTASPDELSPDERDAAAEGCRDAQRGGPGREFGAALDSARVVVGERRGAWTTVVLAGDAGFQALCVTDSSARLFDAMFGSSGVPGVDTPGPREAVATDLGVGAADDAELSVAAGLVGSEVTSVSYDSATQGRVAATVAAGHFALWFPGDELVRSQEDGVRVRLTYADGSESETVLRL